MESGHHHSHRDRSRHTSRSHSPGNLLGDITPQASSLLSGNLCDEEMIGELAKRLFDKYDIDRTGKIHKEAAGIMIVDTYFNIRRKFEPTEEDKEGYFKLLDKEGKGYITPSDLEANMRKFLL